MRFELRFSDNKNEVDIAKLVELYQHTWWANERKAEDVSEMIKHSSLVMMVWDDDQLIGFARVLTDYIYRASIYDVVIHSDYQGQGLGKEIMLRILNHPALSRVEKFWLNTRDKQEFYRKLGFSDDPLTGMTLKREVHVVS